MTTGEIIAIVDELEPNQYSTERKIGWLSNLDGKIWNDVILTHMPERLPRPHWPNPLDIERITRVPIYEVSVGKGPDKEEEEEDPSGKDKPRRWPYHDTNCVLIIRAPYAEDVYSHYLQAMIASENAEVMKYNQQQTLFNSAYQEWCNWYNRTHMPRQAAGGNRYRY